MDVENGRHDRDIRVYDDAKQKASNPTFEWAGGVTSHYVAQPGMFYYEARIMVTGGDGIARLGWSWHRSLESRRILGEDGESVGYGGTGFSSFKRSFVPYGIPFSNGDIIGCYVDMRTASNVEFSFSKNGLALGPVRQSNTGMLSTRTKFTLPAHALVTPAYALKHASVEFNFGGDTFAFPPSGGYQGVAAVAIQRDGLPPGMSISRMLAETRLDDNPPTEFVCGAVLTKRDGNLNTPLHLAVYDDDFSAVVQCLKSIAMMPADARWQLLRLRNSMGRSPLHTATVQGRDIAMTLLLIRAGFPLRDKGTLDVSHKTPLDYVTLPWHKALFQSCEDRRHFAAFLAGSGLLTLRVKRQKVATPYHPGQIEASVWGRRHGRNQTPKVWGLPRDDWTQAKDKNWLKWSCCQGAATAQPCCVREETPAVAGTLVKTGRGSGTGTGTEAGAGTETELEYICPPAMHAVFCNPNLRVEIVRFV